jgi:hypothetical protein
MATFGSSDLRTTRRREVSGPGVGAVAVIAKMPSTVPPDLIIIQRRQQEDMRRAAVEAVQGNRDFEFKVAYVCGPPADMQCKWEQATDQKIRATSVKARVQELLQERKRQLHERQLRSPLCAPLTVQTPRSVGV